MQSSAARREEIQKRLQLLKDQRDRETTAFDRLAAQHPDLSPEKIAEMAKEKAEEDTTKTIEVNGSSVSVSDYVTTKEDVASLLKAEKGFLVHDPVKRVYLGERGKVLRIMPSFQGKPAVVVRFADGAEKIFFVECLAIGPDARKDKKPHSLNATGAGSDSIDKRVNALLTEPEPEAEAEPAPLPGWSAITMPRTRGAAAADKPVVPPPPPFPPREDSGERPAAPPTAHAPTHANPNPPLPRSPEKKRQFVQQEAAPKMATAPASAPPSSYRKIGLVKEAFTDQPSRYVSPGEEELGRPLELDVASASMLKTSPEMDNLIKTPRPDFLQLSPLTQSVESRGGSNGSANNNAVNGNYNYNNSGIGSGSRIPQHCPTDYKAKFSFSDKRTRIPRYAPPPVREAIKFWVAGSSPGMSAPLQFKQVILKQPVDTLDDVLTAVSAALGHAVRAERLFTEAGSELMWPDAITSGMRVVATRGHSYQSVLREREEQNSTQKSLSHVRTSPASAYSGGRTSTALSVSKERPGSDARASTAGAGGVPRTPKSPHRPVIGNVMKKPIHIRVYENGLYDSDAYDRVYRTVTIRPTYKTLSAVKTLINRELEWRDGKKVDMLFDVSGAEIESLTQLSDGCTVIASAGDRFVIPYPTSALHREAMQLGV